MNHDNRTRGRSDPPGLAPRRAALALMLGVRRDGRMLADLLADDDLLAGLPEGDRARAQRLAVQTLRHAARAEAVLAARVQKPPPLRLKTILHLAVVELCAERAAAHGVVNAAVALARENRKTAHLAGLCNAVLRRVAEEVVPVWCDLPPGRLPGWLRGPLVAQYGAEPVAAMEAGLAVPPPLDLTPKQGDAAALAARLGGAALPTGSVRLSDPGQVSALPGYDSGDWWVQDAGAAIPARLLAAGPGERVLDLCAAPGGKTLQLAAAGAAVTALDLSGPRLKRLARNLTRTGLTADIVTADALHWTPPAPFDAILLDAPCSATGTLRRHPDLPFVKNAGDLSALAALQAQMIDRAVTWLKPGGRLVYCTCSLLAAEGEDQIAAALTRHPDLRADAPDPDAFGLPEAARHATGLRLRPDFWAGRGGMDGFYMARLIRQHG